MFKDFLSDKESLFRDPIALDLDFIPPIIEHRENEQQYIASSIKPLFQKISGKNLIITGQPGIGKTVAILHLFNELNKETDDIFTIYINCWKRETNYKIVNEICDKLNYKFTYNKRTDELVREIIKIINKKSVVLCFDEVDKIDNLDLIYTFLEDIYKKTILLITNEKSFLQKIDSRIRSRLMAEHLEFKPYSLTETKNILKNRVKFALVPNTMPENVFNLIAEKTFNAKDIRTGLFLIKESASIAENASTKKITIEHANSAISKLNNFKIRKSSDLKSNQVELLNLIKNNPEKTIKELFNLYQGKETYRTFHRKIEELEKSNLIQTEIINRGYKGKSKVVKHKKLNEF